MKTSVLDGLSLAMLFTIATPVAAQTVDPVTNAQQLEEAISQSHRALEAILNGDPSCAISSTRAPV